MLKMIIADDEQLIRDTLSRLVDWEAMGIKLVACCKNGLEALDAIVDDAPDIVMTDISMPGLSGLELITKIQQIDMQIEFIILSGYRKFEFAKQALEMGIKHYLLKPISEALIIDAVQKAKDACMVRMPPEPESHEKSGSANVDRTKAYVRENLADSNLSLKWIAQNLLFMNVDYLSRQFVTETGEKFSAYLNRMRMETAKKLLIHYGSGKIYKVAEQVGCGNNPQYFSQVFRKYTGMTPSKFIELKKANEGDY